MTMPVARQRLTVLSCDGAAPLVPSVDEWELHQQNRCLNFVEAAV